MKSQMIKGGISLTFILATVIASFLPNTSYAQNGVITNTVTITASDGTTNIGTVTVTRIPGGPPRQASMVITDGYGNVWDFVLSQSGPGQFGDPVNGPYFEMVAFNRVKGNFPDCCGLATFQ